MNRVYFDYAATTPVDPQVERKMAPYFSLEFGNPSSIHLLGQIAEAAIENARGIIAGHFNSAESEIIFTSGGTESNNLALRGVGLAQKLAGKNHILISSVEHPAVSKTALQLQNYFGFDVEYIPVDSTGFVDPEIVSQMIKPTTGLVSVIFANNEIGTVNPIESIAKVCHEKSTIFHTDAMQAGNFYKLNCAALQVDLLTFGGHKIYGPKGIGGLYIRKGTPFISTQTGGSQEFGFRGGTHNVPLIVGLAEAVDIAQKSVQKNSERLVPLRDKIIETVLKTIPRSQLTGHASLRMPNHASFAFESVNGNNLLSLLDHSGYACSSGSACKTGSPEPSEVLIALGLESNWALGSLRVTLGKNTVLEEVENFIQALPGIIHNARAYF